MKTARELFTAKELASVPSRVHSLERIVDYGRRERLLLALARLGTHVVSRAADSSALVPTAKAQVPADLVAEHFDAFRNVLLVLCARDIARSLATTAGDRDRDDARSTLPKVT